MTQKPTYGIYAWPYFVSMITLGILGTALVFSGGVFEWTLVAGPVVSIFGFYSASAHLFTMKQYVKKEKEAVRILTSLLKPENKKLILDVGSGTGRTAIAIIKSVVCCEALGIDVFSRRTILGNTPEKAKRNAEIEGLGREVFFMYGDASNIPFRDHCFDIVTAGSILHLFKEEKRKNTLSEIRRVLKDNGSLVIIEWLRNKKTILLYLFSAFFVFEPRLYWVELLRENGFKNIKTAAVGNLGFFYAENTS